MKKLLAMLFLGLASAGANAHSVTVDDALWWFRVEWRTAPAADGNCYTEPGQGLNSVWMSFTDIGTGAYYDNGPQPLLLNGNECIAVTYFSKPTFSGDGVITAYYQTGWQSIYGWDWLTPVSFHW